MQLAAHGLSRVAFAKAQGQDTSSAFWSGFVSSGFSIGNKGYGGIEARTAIMAIVGGTTSAISGGKFANGAVTGAFVHLFNSEALRWSEEDTQKHNLEVEAIQNATPGLPHYKLGTWKCEDSFSCSVAKGAWDGYDIGNEAGDFVDAYKNQYDLIKNVGRFYGTVLGAIQGAYEYNKRQQVTNKKEEIIK